MGTPLWMPLSLQLSCWQSAWQGGSRSLKGWREPVHQDPAGYAPPKCSWGQVGKAASASCILPAHAQAAGLCQGCHRAGLEKSTAKRWPITASSLKLLKQEILDISWLVPQAQPLPRGLLPAARGHVVPMTL